MSASEVLDWGEGKPTNRRIKVEIDGRELLFVPEPGSYIAQIITGEPNPFLYEPCDSKDDPKAKPAEGTDAEQSPPEVTP